MSPIHDITLSQTVRTLKSANKYGISFTQLSPLFYLVFETHTQEKLADSQIISQVA